jgi:hypothetical protein
MPTTQQIFRLNERYHIIAVFCIWDTSAPTKKSKMLGKGCHDVAQTPEDSDSPGDRVLAIVMTWVLTDSTKHISINQGGGGSVASTNTMWRHQRSIIAQSNCSICRTHISRIDVSHRSVANASNNQQCEHEPVHTSLSLFNAVVPRSWIHNTGGTT